MLRLLTKRILQCPAAISAQYHQSAVVAGGRWGGEKSLESRPRELSRRQKRRKKAALVLKSGKIDKGKKKLKDDFVKSQIGTPEFQELLTQKDPQLNAAIRRMMLPDDVSIPSLDGPGGRPRAPLQALDVLSELSSGLDQEAPRLPGPAAAADADRALAVHVSKNDANAALKTLAALKDVENTEKMLSSMVRTGIPFKSSSLVDVLNMYNKVRSFEKTVELFDSLEQLGMPHPTPPAWAALIAARTQNGQEDVDESIKLLRHLEKSGVPLLADMFNPLLRGLVKGGRHEEAFAMWVEMKTKGITPNVQSYNVMVEQCEFRGQPERAFFLIDEMRLLDVAPTKQTFCKLIRACATAPVWVNGYEDIVSDALAMMEGQEIIPDVDVYNSVMYAFARAGDGAAADFYLQEMRRKRLAPDVKSYNHVFDAYAANQLVGARRYGRFGRYVRPAPPPDTERQALYKEAGFDTVNEELSKTYIKDDPPERGKRVKMKYEDIVEFDEEQQEAFEDNLRLEIKGRKMREEEAARQRAEALGQRGSTARLASGRAPSASPHPLGYGDELEALAAGGDEGGAGGMDMDEVQRLMAGGGDMESMFKALSSSERTMPADEDSLARLMKNLNDDSGDDMDPSIFLSDSDRQEWESFLSEMQGGGPEAGAGAGALPSGSGAGEAAGEGGVDAESEMMEKLNRMLATMDDGEEDVGQEKVQFHTSQSGPSDSQSTIDAFNTLNSLLESLDDGTGGVSMKEHYISSNRSVTGGELGLDEQGLVSTQDIDKLWDLVEFGRPPKPDYSDNLRLRRSKNIDRVLELFEEMCKKDRVEPNARTLAALIGVVGNATLHKKAEELVDRFKAEYNIVPDKNVFDAIIKMHLVRTDMDSALEAKRKMKELGMFPNREVYGMLLLGLTARSRMEDALLTLEEAADNGVTIREVYLRGLRKKCDSLGIVHPDLPEDPMAWMRAVKEARKHRKIRSKRNVQPVQSGLYN